MVTMKSWLVVSCSVVVFSVATGCDAEKQNQEAPAPPQVAVTPVPPEPPAEFDACKDGDCLVVPEGIIGTVFGMDVAAAKERFGALRKRSQSKRRVKAGPTCGERRVPPGVRYRAKTELGGEKATCILEFYPKAADAATDAAKGTAKDSKDGRELGLLSVACDLDGRRDRREHAETAHVLFRSLAKQYGAPQQLDERLVVSGTLSATWTSALAVLEVQARHTGSRSRIALRNVSSKVAEALAAEVAAVQAKCDAANAAREAKAGEEEERLREKARRFEADLRPPLERPKD